MYDRLNETYVVNFQWRVPFSPAALSHIELILIQAHILLKLGDEIYDFTLIQPNVFSDTMPVNVSYFWWQYYNVIITMFFNIIMLFTSL